MKKYIIIGNGVAAAGCIEGIRSVDRTGEITVISEENHPVYCRPLISYYLEGKTDPQRMLYRSPDFYEKNGCQVLYGERAVRLCKESKQVELADGSLLPYDALCIAADGFIDAPSVRVIILFDE
jgi:NAD(P)H-nitrite reductase large subunit